MTKKKELKKKLATIREMINTTQEKRVNRLDRFKCDVERQVVFTSGLVGEIDVKVSALEQFNRDDIGALKQRLNEIDEAIAAQWEIISVIKPASANLNKVSDTDQLLRRIEHLELWKKDVDGDLAPRVAVLERKVTDDEVNGNSTTKHRTTLESAKRATKKVDPNRLYDR